jgi:hypothetical protein
MRQTTRIVIMLGLGCLALAGCASTSTGGEPLPPDADTATVDGPAPLLSIGCDELVDLDAVQQALGTVEAGIDAVRVPGGPWSLAHVALAQSGALECYWGDDAAPQEKSPRYLSVTALPGATQRWESLQPELTSWSQPLAGHGDAAFANCAGSADYLYCEYDVLVGSTWMRAEVMNLDAHEDAAPIIRTLVDALSEADAVAPVWEPTGTLPAACTEWLTEAQISTAVGMDGIAEREFPLSMPIILNGALSNGALSGGLACSWSNSYSSEQAMPIQVAALPGAGWAWDAAWAKARPERSPAAPLDGVGDQAFAGCATDQDVCFVDVLAGGTWLAVEGNKQAGIDGLTRIATAAVAALSP